MFSKRVAIYGEKRKVRFNMTNPAPTLKTGCGDLISQIISGILSSGLLLTKPASGMVPR